MLKLHNTLSKSVQELKPIEEGKVSIYSCGPTVYNTAHIGNLSSYIVADTLRRVVSASGLRAQQVMNYTDIDDKTIKRSQELHGSDDPMKSLQTLTRAVEGDFLADLAKIGVDAGEIGFVRATESIDEMHELIRDLYSAGIAYIADDGVYFSIEAYTKAGKTYGQLTEITAESTGAARVNNDEYDKDNVHDFALWKTKKDSEPSWEFELDGHNLEGRPGWHIECSAMAKSNLGQPFDIHTGGIDLIFPHHENEIAQSTGAHGDIFATMFVHSEHLLVEGKKMAKSDGNVFLLSDIENKGRSPLAFRMMVLQSHYRHQMNFSWDNLHAAENRLKNLRAMADLRHQPLNGVPSVADEIGEVQTTMLELLQDDLNTPEALATLSGLVEKLTTQGLAQEDAHLFNDFVLFLDSVLGFNLQESQDIHEEQKELIAARQAARDQKDFQQADAARDTLLDQSIELKDTAHGTLWKRI